MRLLASPNRAVPIDTLADDVWEGEPPLAAASTLQSHVSALRQLLGPERLVFSEGGYRVSVQPGELDVSQFDADVERGRHEIANANTSAGLEMLEKGLGRWRGSPFADVAGVAWTLPPTARLNEQRNEAIEDALEARLALGLHREVCRLGEEAVAAEPFRERRWAALMVALYRTGRQADALRSYQRARNLLREELGIDPSPQLVRLEGDILAQSPALAWSTPPDSSRSRVSITAARDEARVTNLPAPVSTFVGREHELAELDKLLDTHRLVSIIGAGGIGKTRLALAAAGARLQHNRDGVWLVDLSVLSDADGLLRAVAGVLGLRSTSDEPVRDALMDRIKDLQGLMLFDNCEHIIGDVATLIEGLLETGTGVRVLATSREALRIPGEQVWTTPAIDTPRASRGAGFNQSDGVRRGTAIRRASRRAGRSPRVRSRRAPPHRGTGSQAGWLAPGYRAGRGTSRLHGLSRAGLGRRPSGSPRSGVADGPPPSPDHDCHHRLELPAASCGLAISAAMVVGLHRWVHPRGGGLPAYATTTNVREALAELVDRSLVGRDEQADREPGAGQARFRLLETIRQFAFARLQEHGAEGVLRLRSTHGRYFAEFSSAPRALWLAGNRGAGSAPWKSNTPTWPRPSGIYWTSPTRWWRRSR